MRIGHIVLPSHQLLLSSLVPLTLALAGCGNPLGTVAASGAVTYKGEAVAEASILYLRVGGEQGPSAMGRTNADGQFELITGKHEGAVPGKYSIVVTKDNSDQLGIPDPLPPNTTRTGYMRANNLVPTSVLPLV